MEATQLSSAFFDILIKNAAVMSAEGIYYKLIYLTFT